VVKRSLAAAGALLISGVLASCGGGSDGASSDAGGESQATATENTAQESTTGSAGPTAVFMNAFQDFSCTSGWTTRRGGLGRAPYVGSGSCSGPFPGESGTYNVQLKAQLEFDGSSPYRISINGNTIKEGRYPYSQGDLICDCPDHEKNCPDKVIDISAGTHQIAKGDVIEFWGDDVYPCGSDSHGSYAIWRGISFMP
jgi:hypothetical protein